jgi:hypothetical protein
MKKVILAVMVLGLLLGSCSSYEMGIALLMHADPYPGTSYLAKDYPWVRYGKTDSDIYFYLPEEYIGSPSPDAIRVLTKHVPRSEADRQKEIALLTKEYPTRDLSTYTYALEYMEINCNTREYRRVAAPVFRSEQGSLGAGNNFNDDWAQIPPDLITERLYKIVCTETKKK